MRMTCRLVLCLLTVLMAAACLPASPVSTLPTATLSLPTATVAPSSEPTLAASPTPKPLPTVGVDPASLRGLTIQVWHAFAGPVDNLFTQQAAQFTSENEWGILVHPIGYGDYPSLFDAMNTALDSGQSTDLVAALPEQTLAWDARDAVVDLNLYLNDPRWALPAGAQADIPSAFWAQDHVNGRQLGLPAQRSARFIFYNQTWAHALGFSHPPATAENFRQQACAANAFYRKDSDPSNDGYGGWIVDTDWQTIYSWILAFDGGVVDGNAYAFRTDPNLAALQFVKNLFDNHCAWISTEPTPFDSFARRSALFISADLAALPDEAESMSRLKNSDDWIVIPFPGPQQSVLVAYGPSYNVMKSTPARQLAAWLFARWLLSPESQSQWVEASGMFPLRNSVFGMIQSYRQASPQWDAAIGYLAQAQGVPQLASWRKVRYVLEDGMTVLFQSNLSKDKLPDLLTEMDSTAQELK